MILQALQKERYILNTDFISEKETRKEVKSYLHWRLAHLKRTFIPVSGLKYLKENQAVLQLRIATIAFFSNR